MLFNYDSLPSQGLVVTALIVTGLFAYSFYNIITTNESLVNTITSHSTIDSLQSSAGATELPVAAFNYVDVGVQTETASLWSLFKDWLREVFSVNSSDVGSFGHNRVSNWINNLNSTQEVSTNTTNSVTTYLNLQDTVQIDDSISNVNEVISNVEVVQYNINDLETYNSILVLPDSKFSQILIDGVQQYFIIIGDAILSINPDIMNYFI